jgi:hypothetical protein
MSTFDLLSDFFLQVPVIILPDCHRDTSRRLIKERLASLEEISLEPRDTHGSLLKMINEKK